MAKFKIGDICIIIHHQEDPTLVGKEVTIESDLIYRLEEGGYAAGWYYETDDPDWLYEEWELRLKRPSGEQSVFDMFDVKYETKEPRLV